MLKSTPAVIQSLLAALYHQFSTLSHSSQPDKETGTAREDRLLKLFKFMLFLKMLFSNFPGLMEFADITKWFMHFKSIATSSCQGCYAVQSFFVQILGVGCTVAIGCWFML